MSTGVLESIVGNAATQIPPDTRAKLEAHLAARTQAEQILQANEAKYRSFFRTAPFAIFVTELGGNLIEANETAYEILGYTPKELAGTSVADLYAQPEQRKEFVAKLQSDGKVTFPIDFTHKDGRIIHTNVTAVIEYDEALQDHIIRGTLVDQTEHRQLQEQLVQAQKMEAIGQLAGGVAHDFNNLLTAIMGYTAMVRDDPDLPLQFREDLQAVWQAGASARDLTRQLLAFSRKQVLRPKTFALSAEVANYEKVLRRTIGEHVTLETALDEAGCVHVDQCQLQSIILNLAVNARDAMPTGGELRLRTYTADGRGELDGYAVIEMSDTGHGMSQDVLTHIFEPFYTTKGFGKGTGLGLSTVYGIVKQSGGDIEVESEPGRGATFRIYLPQTELKATEQKERVIHAGHGTVLLVEDDDLVRGYLHRGLTSAGYHVLAVADGSAAVALAAQRPIDIVVTDIVMPGMSGVEAVRRIAELQPATKALYISGYPGDVIPDYTLTPDVPYLPKPMSLEKLTEAVKNTLTSS